MIIKAVLISFLSPDLLVLTRNWERESLCDRSTQPQSIPEFSARFGRLVDRALVKRALEAR